MHQTIAEMARAIIKGRETATSLAEAALARIADPAGEGARAFVRVDPKRVRAEAAAQDRLLAAGIRPSPLAGLPVSVKDLLDVQGEVTTAGSKLLRDAVPAAADAAVVSRLRAAGAVIVGRTNMTEFAYGGIGYNPHYGTAASPWDRKTGRVPGGSSAGAAVSAADGLAAVGIGSDTGGSCRIPAAFCSVVGFKPTVGRIPTTGCLPLSTTLDSIGPLARSVACAAVVDAVLAGEPAVAPEPMPVEGLRLLLPETVVLDGMEPAIAEAFERAVATLAKAGARINRTPLPMLARIPEMFARGGLGGAESYAYHRSWIAARGAEYDPKVRARIEIGAGQSAADYIDLHRLRAELISLYDHATRGVDAVILPTVAIAPPAIRLFGDHQSMEDYGRLNMMTLRNTYIANLMDRCSISLPCERIGETPTGLMLFGERMGDRRLLAMAAGIEAALAGVRGR